MEYRVVTTSINSDPNQTALDLSKKVNDLLRQGWELVGGVAMDLHGFSWMGQAMIKR